MFTSPEFVFMCLKYLLKYILHSFKLSFQDVNDFFIHLINYKYVISNYKITDLELEINYWNTPDKTNIYKMTSMGPYQYDNYILNEEICEFNFISDEEHKCTIILEKMHSPNYKLLYNYIINIQWRNLNNYDILSDTFTGNICIDNTNTLYIYSKNNEYYIDSIKSDDEYLQNYFKRIYLKKIMYPFYRE